MNTRSRRALARATTEASIPFDPSMPPAAFPSLPMMGPLMPAAKENGEVTQANRLFDPTGPFQIDDDWTQFLNLSRVTSSNSSAEAVRQANEDWIPYFEDVSSDVNKIESLENEVKFNDWAELPMPVQIEAWSCLAPNVVLSGNWSALIDLGITRTDIHVLLTELNLYQQALRARDRASKENAFDLGNLDAHFQRLLPPIGEGLYQASRTFVTANGVTLQDANMGADTFISTRFDKTDMEALELVTLDILTKDLQAPRLDKERVLPADVPLSAKKESVVPELADNDADADFRQLFGDHQALHAGDCHSSFGEADSLLINADEDGDSVNQLFVSMASVTTEPSRAPEPALPVLPTSASESEPKSESEATASNEFGDVTVTDAAKDAEIDWAASPSPEAENIAAQSAASRSPATQINAGPDQQALPLVVTSVRDQWQQKFDNAIATVAPDSTANYQQLVDFDENRIRQNILFGGPGYGRHRSHPGKTFARPASLSAESAKRLAKIFSGERMIRVPDVLREPSAKNDDQFIDKWAIWFDLEPFVLGARPDLDVGEAVRQCAADQTLAPLETLQKVKGKIFTPGKNKERKAKCRGLQRDESEVLFEALVPRYTVVTDDNGVNLPSRLTRKFLDKKTPLWILHYLSYRLNDQNLFDLAIEGLTSPNNAPRPIEPTPPGEMTLSELISSGGLSNIHIAAPPNPIPTNSFENSEATDPAEAAKAFILPTTSSIEFQDKHVSKKRKFAAI